MKKSKCLIYSAITLAFITAGCGNNTSNDQIMERLEQEVAHNAAYGGDGNGMESYNIEATIDGNEEEKILKVITDAKIMNTPSSDGTVVGQVKKDEKVIVLGESSDDGWCRLGFNGRVCYIKENSLEIETDEEENDEEENDESQVNNGENSRPTVTTETPVTVEKPGTTTEKPGTTTEKPGTTTEKPGTTTEEPDSSEELPIWPGKEPESSEELPIWTGKEPESSEELPIWPGKEPEQDDDSSYESDEQWSNDWDIYW